MPGVWCSNPSGESPLINEFGSSLRVPTLYLSDDARQFIVYFESVARYILVSATDHHLLNSLANNTSPFGLEICAFTSHRTLHS